MVGAHRKIVKQIILMSCLLIAGGPGASVTARVPEPLPSVRGA